METALETALEDILTHTHKAEMIAYIKSSTDAIDEAFELAESDSQPYAWRAAWVLWSCIKHKDSRCRKYIDRIIKCIPVKPYNQQRELIKILQLVELNEDQEGTTFGFCVGLWERIGLQPSVRYNASN